MQTRDQARAAGRAVSRQSRRDAAACRPPQTCRSKRRGARSTIDPNMPAALSNLGVALYELKDYEEAARAQRKAIAANPDFAEAHSNLGNALHALRRFDEAIAAYRRAIELKPELCRRLGQSRHHAASQRRLRRRHCRRCAAPSRWRRITPTPIPGLGILLLMRGDFAEGWDEYEWRLRSTERKGPRFPGTALAGREPRRQAHLCPGRAGFRRHAAIRPLHAAARRARGAQGDAARASAARRFDAREPAGHRRARRSRRPGALSIATPCC